MIFHIHRELRVHLKYLLAKYNSVFKSLGYNQRQWNILNLLVLQCRTTSKNETRTGISCNHRTQIRVRNFCFQQCFFLLPLATPPPCDLQHELPNLLQTLWNAPFRTWGTFLSFLKKNILFFQFFIVQLQLSAFAPHCSPQPCLPALSHIQSSPLLLLVCGSFIQVP